MKKNKHTIWLIAILVLALLWLFRPTPASTTAAPVIKTVVKKDYIPYAVGGGASNIYVQQQQQQQQQIVYPTAAPTTTTAAPVTTAAAAAAVTTAAPAVGPTVGPIITAPGSFTLAAPIPGPETMPGPITMPGPMPKPDVMPGPIITMPGPMPKPDVMPGPMPGLSFTEPPLEMAPIIDAGPPIKSVSSLTPKIKQMPKVQSTPLMQQPKMNIPLP